MTSINLIKSADEANAKPLMSVSQLAAYLGVAPYSLYEWRARGVGPSYLRVQGQIRYRPEEVEQWLDAQRDRGARKGGRS